MNIDLLDQSLVVLVRYYRVIDKQNFVEVYDYNHRLPLTEKEKLYEWWTWMTKERVICFDDMFNLTSAIGRKDVITNWGFCTSCSRANVNCLCCSRRVFISSSCCAKRCRCNWRWYSRYSYENKQKSFEMFRFSQSNLFLLSHKIKFLCQLYLSLSIAF